MRGIVVEKNKYETVIMTRDARFVKIKSKKDHVIGKEINCSNNTRVISKIASIAAALVLLVGVSTYAYPYSYMSVDVNPSLELTMNVFDRVINSKSLNDDGEIINKNTHLFGKKIDKAYDEIIHEIEENGYFEVGNKQIYVAVVSDGGENKAEVIAEQIIKVNNGRQPEVAIANKERVEEAKSRGISVGKLIQEEKGIGNQEKEKNRIKEQENNKNEKGNKEKNNKDKEKTPGLNDNSKGKGPEIREEQKNTPKLGNKPENNSSKKFGNVGNKNSGNKPGKGKR